MELQFYKINSENFFYEPNRNVNSLQRNYYYFSNNSNKNIYDYTFNKKDKNYFNSRSKNSNNNFHANELNDINNFKFDFSHKNINFNTKSDQKIKLTYEFENISPNEITDKTKELINLQSKMCSLDNENNTNKSNIQKIKLKKAIKNYLEVKKV